MKDNLKNFKKEDKEVKKNKEEKKVVVSIATCPNCKSNKDGVLKIIPFEQIGVEGLRVCKNCGNVFMEATMLEILLSTIETRKNNSKGIIKIH